MGRRVRFSFVVLIGGLVSLGTAVPAAADGTRHLVRPGESIQAAIDAAEPGDSVQVQAGIYQENVEITKDHIELEGHGAVLELPTTVRQGRCTDPADPEFLAGICVAGEFSFTEEGLQVGRRIEGVEVEGFTVRNFPFTGIVVFAGDDVEVEHNRAEDNGEYGVTAFGSVDGTFRRNVVSGSGEAGVYVGDSPEANYTVEYNEAFGNDFTGIFIRNASQGTIRRNEVHDNCTGMILLGGAPGPVADWTVGRNRAFENNRFCPPGAEEEGTPPLSGIGIALVGTTHIDVHRNRVADNVPAGDVPFSGGIVVVSGGPETVPSDNVVRRNRLGDNQPDLFWDEMGTGNRFRRNRCTTSTPPDLCA